MLTNIGNQCVIMKINIYFLDIMKNHIMKNCSIKRLKVCHFQCDHRFYFSIKMGKRKEVHLQKLLNLDCHDSIRFGILQST